MKGRTRWLAATIPIVGLVTAVTVLAFQLDLPAFGNALASARLPWFGLAVGLLTGTVAFAVAKVLVLFSAGGLPLGARRTSTAILASATLNAFVPGRGGDLVRAVFLVDDRSQLAPAIGLVLVERLVDVFVLGLAAALAGFAGGAPTYAWLGLACCVCAVGALWVLSLGERSPILRTRAARVSAAIHRLADTPGRVALAALFSAASWGCNVAILGACLRAVGVPLGPLQLLQAGPLAILAGVLPISVSGIGTRDLALAALLPGHEAETVVAGALLYTLIQAVVLPAAGALSLGGETLRTFRRLADSTSGDA